MTLLVSLRVFNWRVSKTCAYKFPSPSLIAKSNYCKTGTRHSFSGTAKISLPLIPRSLPKHPLFQCSGFGTYKHERKLYSVCERSFHTTQPKTALPPAVWILVRPVMNVVAFLFGRTIRKWWQKLPEEKRTKLFNKFRKYKYHIVGFLSSFALGIVYFFYSHLEKHPLTNRNRLILFSLKDMQNICQSVEDLLVEFSKSDILPSNDFLYRRVTRVMRSIMEANYEDIVKSGVKEWKIYVFKDSETRNAMVLPNGSVFIYSGILDICSTDDELATVLSHEIAHTLLNHQGEMMSRQHFFDGVVLFFIALLCAVLPDAAALLSQIFATKASEVFIHLPFSRLMETEADSVGLTMLAKACFDVRVSSAFWAKMSLIGSLQGEEAPEEFLSTHPAHETRQKNLDLHIPNALKVRELCKCPSLSKIDPRDLTDLWRKQFQSNHTPETQGIKIVLE